VRLAEYQPYGAARAELLAKTGAQDEARHAYEVAIGLERDPAVRRFLQRRQRPCPLIRQSGCGGSRLPSGFGIERPLWVIGCRPERRADVVGKAVESGVTRHRWQLPRRASFGFGRGTAPNPRLPASAGRPSVTRWPVRRPVSRAFVPRP
jgi:hypothetical protein